MEIKITCPVCKAQNTLIFDAVHCRRCKEDLSLLYKVKAYSYKKRVEAIKYLLNGHPKESLSWISEALDLDRK